MSAIKRWCETCEGCGHVDETLGGERFSDPKAECPDCDGKGYWIAHLTQPAQSVDVRAEDLQIETFPPDPGGMRVYLPRGVKVTHKPTGITVACVHERSQHANRDTALRALTAALQEKGNG